MRLLNRLFGGNTMLPVLDKSTNARMRDLPDDGFDNKRKYKQTQPGKDKTCPTPSVTPSSTSRAKLSSGLFLVV